MAKPELGMKRQCQNCGARFFDMSRNPILCPKCGTVFQAAAPVTTRSAARSAPVVADDDEKETEDGAEVVSLEEADADAGEGAAAVEDVEVEDDDETTTDDTFLEEDEESGDDVSNLIDGDIETDEER